MAISIGIPFYNAADTLPDAIRSIFAQTYQDWELILVDDGSTDASLEIARSVNDPRVRVLSDGENRKLPFRLNQIIDEAKFDLIGRMDADDLISPHKFERQLSFFSSPNIQLVTTGVCSLSNDHKPLGYRFGEKHKITMRNLLRGRGITHAPILGRTSWFRKNRYDITIFRSQDAALWCSAHQAGNLETENVHVVDEPIYFVREYHGDLSRILQSHRVLRSLIREYGPESLGHWGTALELQRSYIRSAIFKCCLSTGLAHRIIARRNVAPDSEALKRLQADIDAVRSTEVSGLE